MLIYVVTIFKKNTLATSQTRVRLLLDFNMSHYCAERTNRTILTPRRANCLSKSNSLYLCYTLPSFEPISILLANFRYVPPLHSAMVGHS